MRTERLATSAAQEAAASLARCPRCGNALSASGASVICASCAAEGRVSVGGNVIDWRTAAPEAESSRALWLKDARPADNARRLVRAVKYCLNPVGSPLSPLAWLTRARLRRYYERTRSDSAMARAWAEHYLAELPRRAGMHVLDHGTGRGRNLGVLAQLGFRIAAQDIAPNEGWPHLPECQFQVVPPGYPCLPWRAAEFDLVLDWMVIEHFPPDQLTRLAGEIARVLKGGGHWLVLTANSESLAAESVRRWYGRLHPLDTVVRIASQAGLTMVRQSYEGFYAPFCPVLFDAIRKNCAPWPLDLADYRSLLAKLIPPRRRAVWVAAFRKA